MKMKDHQLNQIRVIENEIFAIKELKELMIEFGKGLSDSDGDKFAPALRVVSKILKTAKSRRKELL